MVMMLLTIMLADQLELQNGERLRGSLVKRDGDTLIFKSETLGEVRLPVSAVAKADPALPARPPGPPPPPPPEWSGFSDTGLSMARGNAETTSFTIGASATRASVKDKLIVGFTSIYATAVRDGEKALTANVRRGSLRFDRNLRDKQFLFAITEQEFDEFQKLDLRSLYGGGYGRRMWDTPRNVLDFLFGVNANRESFTTGVTRLSAEATLTEESTHRINSALTIKHKLALFPNLTRGGEYRIAFDASAITSIAKWLSWQITVSDRFITNPLPGLKKNDLLLTTGVRTTFGAKK